jgi:hypothetical protein
MRMTWWTFIAAAGLAAGLAGRAAAQTPSPYAVTPAAGPWLICLPTNYVGDAGAQLAHDLVTELRSQHGLAAYLFNKGGEEKQKEQQRIAQMRQQQQEFLRQMGITEMPKFRVKSTNIQEQYVVLIAGPRSGWQSMDDAGNALKEVRKMKPPSAKLLDLAFVRVPTAQGDQVNQVPVNPFLSAFVVHNPTIQRAKEPEADARAFPWLKPFNDGMPYSLLKNPKPWTMVVKQFQGAAVIQTNNDSGSGFLKKIGLGSNSTDVLSASAAQAVEMAKFLRQLKFEAYVLHTPYKSLVCVGGFENQNDPNMAQVHRSLSVTMGGMKVNGPAVDLSVFAQPMPLEVPRP